MPMSMAHGPLRDKPTHEEENCGKYIIFRATSVWFISHSCLCTYYYVHFYLLKLNVFPKHSHTLKLKWFFNEERGKTYSDIQMTESSGSF